MWSAKMGGGRKPPTIEQLLEYLRSPQPSKKPHQIIVSSRMYQWMKRQGYIK